MCLYTNSPWQIYVIKHNPSSSECKEPGPVTAFLLFPISGASSVKNGVVRRSFLLCAMGSLTKHLGSSPSPCPGAASWVCQVSPGDPSLPSSPLCTAKPWRSASPRAPQPPAAPKHLLEGPHWCTFRCVLVQAELMQVGKSPVSARDNVMRILFPRFSRHRLEQH